MSAGKLNKENSKYEESEYIHWRVGKEIATNINMKLKSWEVGLYTPLYYTEHFIVHDE